MTRDLLHALAADTKAALLWLPRRVVAWVDAQDTELASQLDLGREEGL